MFIHNHPITELKDAKKLFRVIYGRVDVLLFGHTHESRQWDRTNGIPIILAADNSPGKDWAREIAIENGTIQVKDVSIKPLKGGKKSGK
jgi:predicted phosphodiesterase